MAKAANATCFPQTKGKVPTGASLKGKKVSAGRTLKGGR
jgi:hypothetical protein